MNYGYMAGCEGCGDSCPKKHTDLVKSIIGLNGGEVINQKGKIYHKIKEELTAHGIHACKKCMVEVQLNVDHLITHKSNE